MMLGQQVQQIELRPGNYYQLTNVASGRVLAMQDELKGSAYTNRSPIMSVTDTSNLNQVWMIEHIKEKDLYQLVHSLSTLVLHNMIKEIKLTFGDWHSGQLFWVQKVENAKLPNTFVVREKKASKSVLYADRDGILQFGELAPNKQQQGQWVLNIAEKTSAITQSVIFENAFSNLVIDVPAASERQGEKLCQWTVNKRFNQRFKLQFHENSNTYQIQNVKSKLYLDVKGESRSEGSPVIQWEETGGANQKFYIENQGKDLYLLRCAFEPSLFIGTKGNSVKQGCELVTTKGEECALWRILGQFNKQVYSLV